MTDVASLVIEKRQAEYWGVDWLWSASWEKHSTHTTWGCIILLCGHVQKWHWR